MTIFKLNDIRGRYPYELGEEIAYKIGRAFVLFSKSKQIVVGRDARKSSLSLFKSLTKGIMDQGADVIDIGICSTPMFYFGAQKSHASIMLTASHLTQEYNGFKLCGENVEPISKELKRIEQLIKKNFKSSSKGKIIKKNILNEFINHNLKFFKTKKKLKIVLDAGNGMSGYTLPKIFSKLKNVKLIKQYCDIDFSFPHHIANPLKLETLRALQRRVVEEKADLGIATDSDGDRIAFVDEHGEIIGSDLITALIASNLLKQHKRAKILYDVRCSKAVEEVIKENKGKSIIWKVGHSLIKEKMRKEKVLFAGELSGHMYYKDNNYTESSFITTALVMNMLDEPLSALIAPIRRYYQSGEMNFEAGEGILKKIEAKFKKGAVKIMKLDGLSIYFDSWWFNLRKSGVEDLVRLNIEAHDEHLLIEKREELLNVLAN